MAADSAAAKAAYNRLIAILQEQNENLLNAISSTGPYTNYASAVQFIEKTQPAFGDWRNSVPLTTFQARVQAALTALQAIDINALTIFWQ